MSLLTRRNMMLNNQSDLSELVLFDNGYVNPLVNFNASGGFRRGTTSDYVVESTIYKGRNTGTQQARTIYSNVIDLTKYSTLHFLASGYRSKNSASVIVGITDKIVNANALASAFPNGFSAVSTLDSTATEKYILLDGITYDKSQLIVFAFCDSWGAIYEQTIYKIFAD